jgi:predicted phage terminase large subunit-like protein
MRAASNPGNIGHDWVKQRFLVEGVEYQRAFIPARLPDNPYLDQAQYIKSLNQLDPITRRQYLDGDWTARHGGSIFQREWFKIVAEAPADLKNKCRFWDKAATVPKSNSDPDYTVGVLLGEQKGFYYVLDVKRVRAAPHQVEALIKQTAELDGYNVEVYMEQEPGSAGVESIDHYSREVLRGFIFRGVKTTGSKSERAAPLSSAAEAGNIKLVRGAWNTEYLDEMEAFPMGSHDDQVDASSGAFSKLRPPIEVGRGNISW